jgi:hypothetical protein
VDIAGIASRAAHGKSAVRDLKGDLKKGKGCGTRRVCSTISQPSAERKARSREPFRLRNATAMTSGSGGLTADGGLEAEPPRSAGAAWPRGVFFRREPLAL